MNMPTVFVVDDDDAVRDSVTMLLETAGFRVAGFSTGEAFLDSAQLDENSCLVLDLCMAGISGLDVQSALTSRGIRMPIVFLTAHGDIPTTVRAIKAGAVDFLTKPVDAAQLIGSVQAALQNIENGGERRSTERATRALLGILTEREREVVRLALDGLSNKEIGRALDISHRTVEFHRSRILAKTGVSSLIQLAAGRVPPPLTAKASK